MPADLSVTDHLLRVQTLHRVHSGLCSAALLMDSLCGTQRLAPRHATSDAFCQCALLCPGLLFPRNSLINTATLHLTVCNHDTVLLLSLCPLYCLSGFGEERTVSSATLGYDTCIPQSQSLHESSLPSVGLLDQEWGKFLKLLICLPAGHQTEK